MNYQQFDSEKLSLPLKNIFNYLYYDRNYQGQWYCHIKKDELLYFLNTTISEYEFNENLGILNIVIDNYIWVFPINSKGLYTLNSENFQIFNNFQYFYKTCGYNLNLILYKKTIWHPDYDPLYTYSKEDLYNIFLNFNYFDCIIENISLENIYYSREYNSFVYLNTGLITHLNNYIKFEPYKLYLGKYPYSLDNGTEFSNFKELTCYIDTAMYRNNMLNYINFKGEY